MDWIRRNFPDLLIGLALVVVIGAIIATLLSGGSFLPFGGGQGNTASITGTGVTAPITTNTPSNNQAVNTQTSTETNNIQATDAPVAIIPDGPDVANSDSNNSGVTVEVPPVIPVAVGAVNNAANSVANATGAATTAVTETVANAASSVANAASSASPAIARPSVSANMAAPYRVSVGAFGNPVNAQKRMETFKAKGFPAFSAKQGSLNLVLVGPYETEAEAIKIANEIKSSGLEPGATVIKFNPNASSSSSTNQTTSQASTGNTASSSTATATVSSVSTNTSGQTTAPTTSAAGSYLQVGAYNNSETAQPLRQQLSKLGFETYELQDSNLIKVLVGPYDDANLVKAQSVLKSNGYDSFVR